MDTLAGSTPAGNAPADSVMLTVLSADASVISGDVATEVIVAAEVVEAVKFVWASVVVIAGSVDGFWETEDAGMDEDGLTVIVLFAALLHEIETRDSITASDKTVKKIGLRPPLT